MPMRCSGPGEGSRNHQGQLTLSYRWAHAVNFHEYKFCEEHGPHSNDSDPTWHLEEFTSKLTFYKGLFMYSM